MFKVGHLLKCLVGLGSFRGFPNLWEKKMINCLSIRPSRPMNSKKFNSESWSGLTESFYDGQTQDCAGYWPLGAKEWVKTGGGEC